MVAVLRDHDATARHAHWFSAERPAVGPSRRSRPPAPVRQAPVRPAPVRQTPVRPAPVRAGSNALQRRRRAALVGLTGLAAALAVAGWITLQAVAGAGGGLSTTSGSAGGAPLPIVAHIWVVQPGDTLWSIAEAAHPGTDVRPVVDRLAAETGAAALQAGQHVVVP